MLDKVYNFTIDFFKSFFKLHKKYYNACYFTNLVIMAVASITYNGMLLILNVIYMTYLIYSNMGDIDKGKLELIVDKSSVIFYILAIIGLIIYGFFQS